MAPAVATDVSTHWGMDKALQRRSLALEMSGLVSYETHERLRLRLMRALTEPTFDAAYAAPSVSRVQAADEYLWQRVSFLCARGVKANDPTGTPPADDAIIQVMQSFEFEIKLSPLPAPPGGRATGSAQAGSAHDPAFTKTRRGAKNRKPAIEDGAVGSARPALPPPPYSPLPIMGPDPGAASGTNKGKGKGKGKGRGSGKGSSGAGAGPVEDAAGTFIPKRLRPGVSRTAGGTHICFGYNLGSCTEAAHGASCYRGLHVCCRPGCEQPHPALSCDRVR